MKHYEKAELDMYLHRDMSPPARLACSRHLTSCCQCAKLLDELQADSRLVKQLKSSMDNFKAAVRISKSR